MEHRTVSSSSIESIGYDPTTAVMEIQFAEGDLYEYFMVPQSTYRGLLEAANKGRYFGEFVRNNYRFRKL